MEHDIIDAEVVVDVARADTAAELEPEPIEAAQLIEDELLVEEISIDGMCGVY